MKTPADYPKLNLPACRLRVAERSGELCVWDTARGRWLRLSPEEWVRRHVLGWLTGQLGVSAAAISQEHPVEVGGTAQRADIVVSDRAGRPLLVVECKAPEVAISDAVLAQAFRYNAVLGAPYVILTNGLDHYIYKVTAGEYTPLSCLPPLV
ncbi:MAG: type I restriction enzyme HsdR N-terminal domain-containing protein [Rikenellaceae bacterium]|nr:type I restriction enzyme HsdR N-terminal domain-containing protein [Rikenellaceae bacterium]